MEDPYGSGRVGSVSHFERRTCVKDRIQRQSGMIFPATTVTCTKPIGVSRLDIMYHGYVVEYPLSTYIPMISTLLSDGRLTFADGGIFASPDGGS